MPVVEVDFTEDLQALADQHNRSVGRGCAGWRGCATADPTGLGVTSLLLGLVVARRRRSTRV
ncbi:MAG: MYXO-CTERM sorting domain-containing protein, partial [Myxococcota bacterium]